MQPFRLHAPSPGPTSPVVFDNPHSGTILPDDFSYSCDRHDLDNLSDLHMEKLLADVPALGIPVLENLIHRACIDPNKHEDEIDPALIRGSWHAASRRSANVENGLGLIPTFVRLRDPNSTHGKLAPLFDEASAPTPVQVMDRVARYYRPYHQALRDLINQAHDQNGLSFHINMHSFRKLPGIDAEILLGTRHGETCAPVLLELAREFFESEGLRVACNKKYIGGALVQKMHDRDAGRSSLQIEVRRALYMDEWTLAYDEQKAAALKDTLTRFAAAAHDFTLKYAASFTPAASLQRRNQGPA